MPMEAAGSLTSRENLRVTVLGAGTMGAQIALSLALGHADVRLWARRKESLEEAMIRIDAAIDTLADNGLAPPDAKSAIFPRILPVFDFDHAISGRAFIIEAIAEDLSQKQAVLQRAESDNDAVLSSTTSAISPTDLQSQLREPRRFCVAHFAQPAHLVQIVEVVPGRQTSEETTEFTVNLLDRIGKTPVLCPDIPGFLWARIQHAVLREFVSLVGKGLVTPQACDKILKQGYASRLPAMGAFEHADLAGFDLMNSAAAKAVWADLSNASDPAETPLGKLFAEGHLGMKSGSGFYEWDRKDVVAFEQQRDQEIIRRTKLQRGGEVVL
ncbi:MAG: 3-hydroxyacyl-CoA dehydrogenase family protein [Rhodobacteraceae bacterium]|nr:3-hydroxyacyl-CoA dehydrogenase family protein [Paracoccaceae bacterium]MCY4196279.1 3-hydroxyacyl-CoA dehydrogenase family protein [Paracoccaceae bacterium]MCY4327924.1 3-hydroxyacyl-CoA dehydrogenase family protein [Paracoccaceae bacterium]